MPDTVTKIDDFAFQRCESTKHIKFSKNLKYIGDGALQWTCYGNKKYFDRIGTDEGYNILPNTLKYVGKDAFVAGYFYYDGTYSQFKKLNVKIKDEYKKYFYVKNEDDEYVSLLEIA